MLPAALSSPGSPEATDAAAAAASSISSKQKRTPEDIAYDSLSFLLTSLRTFYMGTAKAVHSPARRREEQVAVPTVPMKAAALNLALLLVGNFQLQPWDQYNEADVAAAAGITAAPSGKPGSSRVEAATTVIRCRATHYMRQTEELNQVLFDHRRRYCHLLALNYFSALGGMKVRRLRQAEEQEGPAGRFGRVTATVQQQPILACALVHAKRVSYFTHQFRHQHCAVLVL